MGLGLRIGVPGPLCGIAGEDGVPGPLCGAGHATNPKKPSGPRRRHGWLGISATVTGHTRERAGLGQVSARSVALHGWHLP